MKLFVLGATGGTGLEIVRQAIEHGHSVTAFVRSPERLKPFRDRITVKQGDLLNRAELEQVIKGHDAYIESRCEPVTTICRGADAFIGPALYALTAIGLFYTVRFAGFLAWFIFIGSGVAEFTHFIFPLLKPAISPEIQQKVSHLFPNGVWIPDLPNYYIHTTGTYYFAGMYTAILPMIPFTGFSKQIGKARHRPNRSARQPSRLRTPSRIFRDHRFWQNAYPFA